MDVLDDLGLEAGASIEKWDEQLQEKLGLKIIDLQNAICEWIKKNSEELTHEFVNIAPSGDYGKLLEDNDSMAEFLKNESAKPEHWNLMAARGNENPNLIQFMFDCEVVDEGDTFKGFVFVSKSGKIRHAFAQNQA